MNSLYASFQDIVLQMHNNMHLVLTILAFLWIVHIVNAFLGYRLNYLGIYPRHPFGLIGIPFSPVLHGNFNHLFFNSVPLFVLMHLVLLNGDAEFVCVTAVVILISGLLVWLFGRKGLHVGASSLIMGYWGFMLANAYTQPGVVTIISVMVSLYYFGGLLSDLFPTEIDVSIEGHIFGFLSGLSAIYLCPIVARMMLKLLQ